MILLVLSCSGSIEVVIDIFPCCRMSRSVIIQSTQCLERTPVCRNHIGLGLSMRAWVTLCIRSRTVRDRICGISMKNKRTHINYTPNFEEVEGAYWFGPLRPSVMLCIQSRTVRDRILKLDMWN